MCFLGLFSSLEGISMLFLRTWQIFGVKWCDIFRNYTILLYPQFHKSGERRWVISLSSYLCCAIRWCYSSIPSYSSEHRPTTAPSTPVPARPPIVQVYSRRRENNDTLPVPVYLPSNHTPPDPLENIDLSITLCKSMQTCKSTYFIDNLFPMIAYFVHWLFL